jgi:hypothetical protein
MIGRSITQFVVEFITTTPDRFRMQARDFRDPLEPAMPQTHGFSRRHPATLLFVQPAQQQIELPMIVPLRVLARQTLRTPAIVYRQ